jgi:hypothetical protein
VDSDIILPPLAWRTLAHHLEQRKEEGFKAIAPLVNMGDHIDTVAWNYMDWNHHSTASAYRSAVPMPTEPFEAGVIMAAMLIHRTAFEVLWHEHDQGEDIGWSWHAREAGVRLLVDPTVVCEHRMRPVQ